MTEEATLKSRYDGLDISVVVVRPEGEARAVLQLSHGMSGCKERFMPFMEFMAEQGGVCVANDHRGHGDSVKTAKELGYMYEGGQEALIDDMRGVTEAIADEYPGLPLFLLGHSMGSLAARAYTKKNDSQLDGLILCGSPSPNSLAPIGRLIVKEMCRKDNGKRRPESLQKFTSSRYNRKFRQEGYQAWTCSDPEVRRRFADDPRCNFNITADIGKWHVNR